MDQPVSSETLGKTAHEVTTSQDFKTLVSRRWTVSTVLLVLLFASYYGYILLVAGDRALVSRTIGEVTTLAIPLGVAAIVVAWVLTGSLTVMASMVDSLMDAASSTINLVAVRWSLNPADEDHRFGHGKAEFLAGLAQASFISGSAFFLLVHAIVRLRIPTPVTQVTAGLVIMALAIIATVGLLAYQRRVIRRTS